MPVGALAIALGGLLGLVIGSFASTLILRWPRGEGVVAGRSRCDGCGRELRPHELLPVISWALQRGRCRTCDAGIDPLHPATELLFALIGAGALAMSPTPAGMALALLGWQVATAAIMDARHQWLPHVLSGLLVASGLALGGFAMSALGIDASINARLIGAAAGFGGLWLIGTLYRASRGRQGLGGGDPPFLAGLGAWIGWQGLPFLLLLASLCGMAVALFLIATRRTGAGAIATMRLPLGTLLGLALPFALAVMAR